MVKAQPYLGIPKELRGATKLLFNKKRMGNIGLQGKKSIMAKNGSKEILVVNIKGLIKHT